MVDITQKYARELDISNPMGIPAYDFIINTYSGANIASTTYKRGGASGTTVAVVKPFGNLPARRADITRRIRQERTKIFKLVESYGIFNVGVCFCLMDINNNREEIALATSSIVNPSGPPNSLVKTV